ncbi:MAG TPA: FAD-dependent oxidoreductase [Acidimicrobiia bacterium]|nr:FAD-dependent oxidoreductase [Acidimicrobiia bacterium]
MDSLQFFDANIPCMAACPVHTNAGVYVAAVADGDDELGFLTARLPNPFASVCGHVCAAPCEEACRRGEIDRPIAIRALKRFLTEKHGVEAGEGSMVDVVAGSPLVERQESIGVVGGGPAGLSAAHDLRRLGYEVVLYEAADRLGGMMVLGIPEYRLERDLVGREIDFIVGLGVEVEYGFRLGRDASLDDLRDRHDALFLAFGATVGRGLDIEGSDADGVLRAIEYLLNVNQGFKVDVGDRVLVVGGGDVAMDAARTALRSDAYGERHVGTMTEALDAARTAARAGAREVIVMSLESPEEMPASEFEIEEAVNEDISFIHRRGPNRIITDSGRVVGVETVAVTSVFDAEGRFAPHFDGSDLQEIDVDTVILAVGQAVDTAALGASGLRVSRGTIEVDERLGTSLPMVWAGGDVAHGPRTLIEAIADGRRAAEAIHKSFGGSLATARPGQMVVVPNFHRDLDEYDRIPRVEVPTIPSDRRIGLELVETGFTEEQARTEAQRCLRCFANILLDVDKCVLCALCADVCPVDVLSLVPSEEIDSETVGGTALLLDERACIRCGLCIERCPTDALSMGVWTGVGVPEKSMGKQLVEIGT